MNIVAGIFCILIGVYSAFCCAFNIDFFFPSRHMKRFVDLFGRTAVRVIYFIVGLILIVGSIIVMCSQSA